MSLRLDQGSEPYLEIKTWHPDQIRIHESHIPSKDLIEAIRYWMKSEKDDTVLPAYNSEEFNSLYPDENGNLFLLLKDDNTRWHICPADVLALVEYFMTNADLSSLNPEKDLRVALWNESREYKDTAIGKTIYNLHIINEVANPIRHGNYFSNPNFIPPNAITIRSHK